MKKENQNYIISEDLRRIAEDKKFAEKYPDIAINAIETHDFYLAKAKEK